MSRRPPPADIAAWRARCLMLAALDPSHAARLADVAPTLMGVPRDAFVAATDDVRAASDRADAWRVALNYNAQWAGL